MKRFRQILLCTIGATLALPSLAQTNQYAITAAQVAQAITRTGMQVTPAQVTLLSNVVAATPAPVLQVRSVNFESRHRITARLVCAESQQCLPFIVAVRLKSQGRAPVAQPNASVPQPAPVRSLPQRPAVRWGSRAVLLLVAPHMQIRVPVICMQNGSVGQTIRVTSADHRETYSAQVVSSGFLRGTM